MPRLLFTLSSQAIINARVISLTAPIDGRVAQAPPPEGSMVQSGSRLLTLENSTVDRGRLDELKAARTRADGERVATETLAKSLRELLVRLDRQFSGYRGASVSRLNLVAGERQADIESARAALVEAQRDLERKRALHAKGYASEAAKIQSEQAVARARAELKRSQLAATRAREEVDGAQRGVFVSQDHNDVPYSQQRTDEIRVRLAEVEASLAVFAARIAQLDEQLVSETRRIAALSAAEVAAPASGVVWRPLVVAGSSVARDAELLTLIDCSELYVTATFGAGRFDELRYGQAAEVKVLNSETRLKGTVVEVRAVSRSDLKERFAALLPALGEREVMAVIRLDQPGPMAAEKYCSVGRRVEVRFAGLRDPSGPAPAANGRYAR